MPGLYLQVLLDEGGQIGFGAALELNSGRLELVAQMRGTNQHNLFAGNSK